MPSNNQRHKTQRFKSANKLYFGEFQPIGRGLGPADLRFYWVLKDLDGNHLASSNHLYPSKLEAIVNAITLFGRELWAGSHAVIDEDDWGMVLAEGVRMGKLDPQPKEE